MRNKNLDNAKWILTLLIVLFHIQFVGDDEKYSFCFLMIKNLGDCVVPAFAIISGFLFWSTVRNFNDLKGKNKRRIHSLLLPYALWNLINTFLLNWKGGRKGISLLDVNIWRNIIMWDSSPHFWYLFMLMFWTVLSPVLYFLYRKKGGIVALFALSGVYLIYKGDNVLHSRFIYILYTWSGLMGFYHPDFIKRICFDGKKRKIITIASMIAYIGIYFIYSVHPIGMGIKVWLFAVRAVVLLITLLNIPLTWIGEFTGYKYSFWIFAVHFWLDSYLGGAISRLIPNVLLYQIVTWLIVVAVGLITGIIVRRTMPIVYRLLTGSREMRNKDSI